MDWSFCFSCLSVSNPFFRFRTSKRFTTIKSPKVSYVKFFVNHWHATFTMRLANGALRECLSGFRGGLLCQNPGKYPEYKRIQQIVKPIKYIQNEKITHFQLRNHLCIFRCFLQYVGSQSSKNI